jgi:hypothetical protein
MAAASSGTSRLGRARQRGGISCKPEFFWLCYHANEPRCEAKDSEGDGLSAYPPWTEAD